MIPQWAQPLLSEHVTAAEWQALLERAPLDLRVRRNRFGYLAFLLVYQVLCSFASIVGYAQEIVGTRRRWK